MGGLRLSRRKAVFLQVYAFWFDLLTRPARWFCSDTDPSNGHHASLTSPRSPPLRPDPRPALRSTTSSLLPAVARPLAGSWLAGKDRGRAGDGPRALEAAGARRARPPRAGLLPRRGQQVASPLAGYVHLLPHPPSVSARPRAAPLTAASRLQVTLGGSTACARGHLPAIGT
jgi:hypothetical protein